jgi:hypothetical protein
MRPWGYNQFRGVQQAWLKVVSRLYNSLCIAGFPA